MIIDWMKLYEDDYVGLFAGLVIVHLLHGSWGRPSSLWESMQHAGFSVEPEYVEDVARDLEFVGLLKYSGDMATVPDMDHQHWFDIQETIWLRLLSMEVPKHVTGIQFAGLLSWAKDLSSLDFEGEDIVEELVACRLRHLSSVISSSKHTPSTPLRSFYVGAARMELEMLGEYKQMISE